jgi:hypothetical protein
MYRYIVVPLVLFVLLSCATTSKEGSVADMNPVDAGMADGGIMAYFPTRIRQIPLTLSFDPRNDMVYIQFRYQTVTYRQYWDPANRARFIAAVERYHADYEARNLPERKRRKSRRVYDTLKSLTEWETFKITTSARSHPRIYLGYAFPAKNPYFLVTQLPAKNEVNVNDYMERNSLQIELYFTRAMATALAQLFDQGHLNSLVPDYAKDRASQPGASLPPDDYPPVLQPETETPAAASQSPVPQPGTEAPATTVSQPDASQASAPQPVTEAPAATD